MSYDFLAILFIPLSGYVGYLLDTYKIITSAAIFWGLGFATGAIVMTALSH